MRRQGIIVPFPNIRLNEGKRTEHIWTEPYADMPEARLIIKVGMDKTSFLSSEQRSMVYVSKIEVETIQGPNRIIQDFLPVECFAADSRKPFPLRFNIDRGCKFHIWLAASPVPYKKTYHVLSTLVSHTYKETPWPKREQKD